MIIIQTPIGNLSPKSRSSTWGTAVAKQGNSLANRDSINHCILWFITSLHITLWAFAILTFWPSGDITFMLFLAVIIAAHTNDALHWFALFLESPSYIYCILYIRSCCCNVLYVNALHFFTFAAEMAPTILWYTLYIVSYCATVLCIYSLYTVL